MHFDDRLATVLRNPADSEPTARAQFRQLLDLLGTLPSHALSEQIDAAYLRLGELADAIPAAERAAMITEPVLRIRSPRLVAQLALAEPAVASAAMARAELSEEQWLDLIPALPVQARGAVRQQRSLPTRAAALLARLGIADRGLPPAEGFRAPPVQEPQPQIDEIGAIVRRIEAFRKTRAAAEHESAGEPPRFALGADESPPRSIAAFDFATDSEGRLVWADSAIAPAAVGLRLAARDAESPVRSSTELLAAFRHRQPIAGATVMIDGAPAVAGEWRLDAAPRFDQPGGRFVGYLGRLRRPAPADAAQQAARAGEADRMREMLHELRSPVNAIQGFAEAMQQQLFGPIPHEYRALAAVIAGDSARLLAGFDELDRLVKLDSGAITLDAGCCDLLPVLSATLAQLESFNEHRGSALELECGAAMLPLAIAQAEAERLVWRLLATLAGAAAPGEVLRLQACFEGDEARRDIRLTLRLPASLAAADDEALLHAAADGEARTLGAGMFGAGFALRLSAAEARAAGGSLERREGELHLSLPGVPSPAAVLPDAGVQ